MNTNNNTIKQQKEMLIEFAKTFGDNHQNKFDVVFDKYKVAEQRKQFLQPRVFQLITSEEIFNMNEGKDDSLEKKLWQTLEQDQELALTSRVFFNNRNIVYHIPMLDLDNWNENIDDGATLNSLFPGARFIKRTIFESSPGHRHIYFHTILPPTVWLDFLGNAMLTLSETLDTRWIAYSLKRGYSSLRWTCNTLRYTQTPMLLSR